MKMITAEAAISQMGNPTKWMKGNIFSCQIIYYQPTEVSFDVDCTQPNWRDELLALWEKYRKDNFLPEECVAEAWATVEM